MEYYLEKMDLKQLYNKTSIYLSLSRKWSVYYYRLFALTVLFVQLFIAMNLLPYTHVYLLWPLNVLLDIILNFTVM